MRDGVITEADTCRELVTPRLVEAGWGAAPHVIGEQRSFTNGRIIVAGGKVRRGKQKRADYLLYYRRDYPLAVVEAKEISLPAETGVQQAREYAEILGLKFAYATNGHRIIEIDYTAGTEREVDRYATPDELFARLTAAAHLPQEAASHLLEPFNLVSGKVPRYYQQIAIQRVIEAILLGQKRILATLATGTGKTCVAFQICWKLWSSRWNRTAEYRRPKILFLADRNILVDDPMAKMFAPFGDARHKIAGGDVSQSRDMYFGIYQALSTASTDVFRQYRPDFFDLIIIDECHRGSSREESAWRIELKKGGFELTRKEINQADGYVQDIAASGALSGTPFICAWVVGQKIAAGVERDKQLGNPAYGRIRAATFGSLVDTANARLLKLRTVLADRYGGSSTDELLNRVFAQPTQGGLGI